MKRWWWAVLGAVAIVAAALFVLTRDRGFDFLRGRKPIQTTSLPGAHGVSFREEVYTFPAQVDQLMPLAKRELEREFFTEPVPAMYEGHERLVMSRPKRQVTIHKDTRYVFRMRGSYTVEPTKGWVTVFVLTEDSDTWWTRLLRRLGL